MEPINIVIADQEGVCVNRDSLEVIVLLMSVPLLVVVPMANALPNTSVLNEGKEKKRRGKTRKEMKEKKRNGKKGRV